MQQVPRQGITGSTSLAEARKRLLAYALSFSLVLHIGAALIIIIAGGMGGERGDATFLIQDVSLSPAVISSPKPVMSEPPQQNEPQEVPAKPDQQPVEQPQESSGQQTAHTESAQTAAIISTPLGMGMSFGYFSGLADGRSLREDIRGYYFEMVEKINREWWQQAELLKEPIRQDGIIDVLLQRDGTVLSIRIVQGTGLADADRVLAEIIKKSSPLPPLPASYDQPMFRAPLRIKAPSFLMRLRNN